MHLLLPLSSKTGNVDLPKCLQLLAYYGNEFGAKAAFQCGPRKFIEEFLGWPEATIFITDH